MDPTRVATVILAGGQGTRLYPITKNHCKPAVSFGGRYRLIDIPISNSIHSDLRQIFVIAQYLPAELQHHISQTYRFDSFKKGFIDVLTPEIDATGKPICFRGTADAVRKTLATLLKSTADYFLILSGDQLYRIDFQKMVHFAAEMKADLTIASLPVEESEARRFGLLKLGGDHHVVEFIEKPQDADTLRHFALPSESGKPRFLASMGIYVFTRAALIRLLTDENGDDFGRDLLHLEARRGKTFAFVHHGYWEDIGTVQSYYEANLCLTELQKGLDLYDEARPIFARPVFLPGPKIIQAKIDHSILCEGSLIEADEIQRSIIGLRSHIKKGTVIRHSILMGNPFYMTPTSREEFWIGENCLIEKAIIDEHVRIGHHVKLTNRDRMDSYDGDGVYIRDGILIVTAGTVLPDHFVL